MNDIILRFQDFPLSIKGFTLTDENNDYNIYINSKLSIDQQEKTKLHELEHIKRDHHYCLKSVDICEIEVL